MCKIGDSFPLHKYDDWWWVSDHELVIQRPLFDYLGDTDATSTFILRDVASGVEKPLVGLTKFYKSTKSKAEVKPSPNGQRVWWYLPDDTTGDFFYFCELDGSRSGTLAHGTVRLFWTADSEKLLSVVPVSEVRGPGNVHTQKLVCRLLSPGATSPGEPHAVTVKGDVIIATGFVDLSGHLVAWWFGLDDEQPGDSKAAEIDPVAGTQGTLYFKSPSGQIFDKVVDPTRKRIAWHAGSYEENGARNGESIWVSNLDGSPSREIGRIPVKATLMGLGPDIGRLMWTPSGRFLSFVLGNELRIVPAE